MLDLTITVDGWNVANQLRSVVYPISYRFSTSQVVVWDFFHQQYHNCQQAPFSPIFSLRDSWLQCWGTVVPLSLGLSFRSASQSEYGQHPWPTRGFALVHIGFQRPPHAWPSTEVVLWQAHTWQAQQKRFTLREFTFHSKMCVSCIYPPHSGCNPHHIFHF